MTKCCKVIKMYKEVFPSRLKEARKDAGYTQAEIAKIIKIQRQTLASYEIGRTEPDIEILKRLAEFYCVSADWLLGTGRPKTEKESIPEESFAGRLKKARLDCGLTQKEVEKDTKIKQSTLASYETGRTQPDIENLGTLAHLYNVSVNWLIGAQGNQKGWNKYPH